jgi:hypothetical protein
MIDSNTENPVTTLLKNMSAQDFRNLGINQVAYICPVEDQGKTAYAVCTADGRRLSVMKSFEEAVMISLSNKLEPVTVH